VTQAGGLDLDKNLAESGLGAGDVFKAQVLGEIVDNCCLHEVLL
jgi:hypothetical protein